MQLVRVATRLMCYCYSCTAPHVRFKERECYAVLHGGASLPHKFSSHCPQNAFVKTDVSPYELKLLET